MPRSARRFIAALISRVIPLVLVGLLTFGARGAEAAEITMGEDCDIHLSGQIVKGDADRFAALMSEGACSYSTLHLSSPGGSVTEALAIPEHFSRTRTVIDAGQSCLSACALVFMAGHTCAGAPYICAPTRQMHPTATLGFHAPFLQANQQSQLVPLDLSFSAALEIFAQIQRAFSQLSATVASTGYKQSMIHPDLFAQMFSTPPERFYTITTNDQFYSFDIGLMDDLPADQTPHLSRQQAATLCYNLLYSTYRGWNHSEFGFDDYDRGAGDALESVEEHALRSLPAPWLGEGVTLPVQFVRFRYLNLGQFWSGWCEIQPEPGSATLTVSLYPQDALPGTEDRAEHVARMHYSMAWSPRTPVTATSWTSGQTAAAPVPGPEPVSVARDYFDRLGRRAGGAPAALWVPEKRAAIENAAANICEAALLESDSALSDGTAASLRLRARVGACGSGASDVYTLEMRFVATPFGWQIAALNSAD